MAITQRQAPLLRSYRPDAPAALETVVMKCLEKDRVHRYGSIEELAQALAPFAPARSRLSLERISASSTNPQFRSRQGSSPMETMAAAAPTPPPRTALTPMNPSSGLPQSVGTQAGWGNTQAERRASPLRWGLVAGVIAVLGVGGVFIARSATDHKPDGSPASALATTASADKAPEPAKALEPAKTEPVAKPAEPEKALAPSEPMALPVTPVPEPVRAEPTTAPTTPKAVPSAPAVVHRPPAASKKPPATPAAPKTPAPAAAPKRPSEAWEDDR